MTRPVKVKTALGDEFVFHHLSGREEVSRPFRFDMSLLAESDQIALEDMLGTAMTVTLDLVEGGERHLHGIVCHAAYGGTEGIFARYQVCLVPWLWFLTRSHDCRIFQELNAVDIVKSVLGDYDIADFEERLSGSYETREYCVQYRESDFDFVSRLLESEGIAYYFKHEEDRHVLILADGDAAYESFPSYEEVPYFPREDQARRERDHVYEWRMTGDVQPGVYVHTSFDFKKPKADLEAKLDQPMTHALGEGEVYDYPGPHVELGHGDAIARRRLEAMLAQHHRVQGEGTAAGLASGHTFELTRNPREDQNREYLVLSVEHEIWADEYRSQAPDGGEEVYLCRFAAMPSDRPFRPACVTPKRYVHGPQTAIVTGPGGEEIWCDQFGRVKVQFHWDREGGSDEHSSCWVRPSQAWAGVGFGSIHIPRIGQEVIVEFLEGDPDRPIITGRVYNASCMPPYDLPANATQSGIKSNSSKGGGGWNELRFEDKKGEEEVYIQAEKDENILVKNDKSETVGHDETISIGNDRTEQVGNDETLAVGNDRTRTVAANESVTVGNDQTVVVAANQSVSVGSNRNDAVGSNETRQVGQIHAQTVGVHRNITVGANQAHQIGRDRSAVVGGSDSHTVGGNRSANVAGNDSLSAGRNRTASVGDNDTVTVGKDGSVTIGKNLTITAGDQITLQTGKATIVMKKDGSITIKGKDILIDASGKIDIKAKGNITEKGQKILQN
jgi:type VI secretion system secreted protein VgrG